MKEKFIHIGNILALLAKHSLVRLGDNAVSM